MQNTTINEIEKIYDLELDKVVEEIKKNKAKLVLLQFHDGLKPYATVIVYFLEEKTRGKAPSSSVKMSNETSTEFLISLGSCFGACDLPVSLENMKIDLIVQFGHNELMPDY